MSAHKTYLVLETSFCSHSAIYFVRGRSLDDAINRFCRSISGARMLKNGRWRWGNDYYDSAKHLLASMTEVALEFKLLTPSVHDTSEVFCGINWVELFYGWNDKDFYMRPRRRIGKFYEWYSRDMEYYALHPSPGYLAKRIKKVFARLPANDVKKCFRDH